MKLAFQKYHGTGNDFILIDNRQGDLHVSQDQVARLCHRRFGIGADGLMLLNAFPGYDFGMTYCNSDGRESTMCGNGGRCITAFASDLGIIRTTARFMAVDGEHTSEILDQSGTEYRIKLNMSDVPASAIRHRASGIGPRQSVVSASLRHPAPCIQVDTGSPHLVLFVDHAEEIDVVSEGRRLRNDPLFAPGGINVDFVEIRENRLFVRTYERGVEDETLSCGTGVTAAAVAVGSRQRAVGRNDPASGIRHPASGIWDPASGIRIETAGGILTVSYRQDGEDFREVWLEGPAELVFRGEMEV